MAGTFTVQNGEVLRVIVGAMGGTTVGAGGGGGGSAVVNTNTATLLIVAGGGGGRGRNAAIAIDGQSTQGTGSGGSEYPLGINVAGGGGGINSAGAGAGANARGGAQASLTDVSAGGSGSGAAGGGGFGGGGGTATFSVGGGGGGYSGGNCGQSTDGKGCGFGGYSYNVGSDQVNTTGSGSTTDGFVVITAINLPAINVRGNGNTIANGANTTSTNNNTDFGVGSTTKNFTIQSTGAGALNISSISFAGANPGDFAVTNVTLPATVAVGSNLTFGVIFTPGGAGARTASLTVSNTDCSQPAYTFAIQGTGAAANTSPSVTVPASPVIAEATGPSGAVVNFSVTASDPEDGTLTPVVTPASGSTFPLGTNTVTAVATDSGSLSATNIFLVIVRDTTAPMISVPSNLDIGTLSPTGATAIFSVSANDLVDGSVTANATPASGSSFPVGTNIVTVTAADARGNSATNTFLVFVSNPPELHIIGDTNLVTVFWQNVQGWGLRQNSDLLQNIWSANTNAILTAGTNYLMVPNPTGNEFYRLAHP